MYKFQVVHAYFNEDVLTDRGVIVLDRCDEYKDAQYSRRCYEAEQISPLSQYRIRCVMPNGDYALCSDGVE